MKCHNLSVSELPFLAKLNAAEYAGSRLVQLEIDVFLNKESKDFERVETEDFIACLGILIPIIEDPIYVLTKHGFAFKDVETTDEALKTLGQVINGALIIGKEKLFQACNILAKHHDECLTDSLLSFESSYDHTIVIENREIVQICQLN